MGKLHHFLVVFRCGNWCYRCSPDHYVIIQMFTLPWGILLRGMGLPSAIPSGFEIPTGRGRRSLNRRIAGLPSAVSSCARLRPKTKHSVWKNIYTFWQCFPTFVFFFVLKAILSFHDFQIKRIIFFVWKFNWKVLWNFWWEVIGVQSMHLIRCKFELTDLIWQFKFLSCVSEKLKLNWFSKQKKKNTTLRSWENYHC